MKVLATTSQSVLAIDCDTGDARVVHRGDGLYYGIARMGAGYAVAARRRLVSSPVPRTEERGCILRFDGRFRPTATLEAPFPLRDLHQIAWFDEKLWVTCSFDDTIAVHDGSAWEQWRPELPSEVTELRADVENDRHHYNSFFVGADEFALLAHNHGPSDLRFFERRSRALLRSVPLGRQAHNIWLENGAFATCSSIEGKLVATDGWALTTGGFPRGICFDARYRAVGISALSERGRRDWASAAIAVHEASWRLRHYVHLPKEGMVLDLAPMGASEWHGAALETCRFPLLDEITERDLLDDEGGLDATST